MFSALPLATYPLNTSGSGVIIDVEATLTNTSSFAADMEQFAGYIAVHSSSGVLASSPVSTTPIASNFGGIMNTSAFLAGYGAKTVTMNIIGLADASLVSGGTQSSTAFTERKGEILMVGTSMIEAETEHHTGYLATLYVTSTMNATISISYAGNATLNGTGIVNAPLVIVRPFATTTLSGTSTVTSNAIIITKIHCLMQASGTFAMSLGEEAEAQLIGKSRMFANAVKIFADPIDAGSGFAMMPSVVKQTIKAI